MEGSQLNTIAIQVAYILIIFLVFIGLLFWWRIRLGRKVGSGEYIVAAVIPSAGKVHNEILRVVDGKIKIKPKNGKKGKTYIINDINVRPIDYPTLPRFLSPFQVTASWLVLDEESAEPLTNRIGIGGITPEQLYAIEEGLATQAAVAMSKAEEEIHQKIEPKKGGGGISLKWIIIMLVIAAVAVGAFFLLKQNTFMKDSLGVGAMLWLTL